MILIIEAVVVYSLVLGAHSLRHRAGLAPYYALIGGLTAIMSWVTDAGVIVQVGEITFLVGSTVFYTSLLLGVFVVYVFDGPRATRIAISTIVGVSVMVPLIAVVLNLQAKLTASASLGFVPNPDLRINAASVFATLMDLLFLAIAWEYMNNRIQRLPLALRAFITLLGVMWLDVVLFNVSAFAGTDKFLGIFQGTFFSRFIVSIFAAPMLWAYMAWQNRRVGTEPEKRPVLAILRQINEIKLELSLAQQEIERRKKAEKELQRSQELLRNLASTDDLTKLANRRQFRESALREMGRCERYGHPLAMISLDVDRFKAINDKYGHDVGDAVLCKLARAGLAQIREVDFMGRLGGDEFGVMLVETSRDEALSVAQRLVQAIAQAEVRATDELVPIRVSAGLAAHRRGQGGLDELLKRADEALYKAKAAGGNQVALAG